MVSHFKNGKWGNPEIIELWGDDKEKWVSKGNPFIQPDGSKLFFRARYSFNGSSGRDSDI